MLPIVLDDKNVKILIVGKGKFFKRRCGQIASATKMQNPTDQDLQNADVVFIAGLSRQESETVLKKAKQYGALVNVEDINDLCDFHMPSILRRSDLLISVSTGGKSPALARILREFLEKLLPESLGELLKEIAKKRQIFKSNGASAKEIREKTAQMVKESGLI